MIITLQQRILALGGGEASCPEVWIHRKIEYDRGTNNQPVHRTPGNFPRSDNYWAAMFCDFPFVHDVSFGGAWSVRNCFMGSVWWCYLFLTFGEKFLNGNDPFPEERWRSKKRGGGRFKATAIDLRTKEGGGERVKRRRIHGCDWSWRWGSKWQGNAQSSCFSVFSRCLVCLFCLFFFLETQLRI